MAKSGGARPSKFHVHGGLLCDDNTSHVNAALQTILHVPFLERFLRTDFVHRRTCRSLINCMICPLFAILEKWQQGHVADPAFFVAKWKDLSRALSADRQRDSYEVFYIFLCRMRLDHLRRHKTFTHEDYLTSVITAPFKMEHSAEVSCPVCGTYENTVSDSIAVELSDMLSGDLVSDLTNSLLSETQGPCVRCRIVSAGIKPFHVKLPNILIVHCNRCSPNFRLQFSLQFLGKELSFKSCLVESTPDGDNSKRSLFINFCPDGYLRKFEDARIESMTPGRLAALELLQTSKLTLFYETVAVEEGMQQQSMQQEATQQQSKREHGLKILSFPRVDVGMSIEYESPKSPKYRSVGTQTHTCIRSMEAETQTDTFQIVSYNECKNHNKFKFFTGICKEDFEILYQLIGGDDVVRHLKLNYSPSTPKKAIKSKVSGRDRLFMFLLRLRRGLPLEELAFVFQISDSYVGEICYAITRLIYQQFKSFEVEMFASTARQRLRKPPVMKPFKNLRVIIDGATFFIQAPSNFEQQGNTYSSYKSCNGLVFVIGISPNAASIFCSEGFEGSMSDKESVINSGLLQLLEKGDSVMCDRGYELTAELEAIGCHLYKPPSLGGRESFTPEEQQLTEAIAAARIYCEHAIADIKDNRLLQGVIPLSLLPVIPQLVYIACFMRNFNPSRISSIRKFDQAISTDSNPSASTSV